MKTVGKYLNSYRSDKDVMCVVFEIENEKIIPKLEGLKDKNVFIDLEKVEDRKSNQANKYLWKLCDLIAAKLRTNKDIIYLMKLEDYGSFVDIRVQNVALEATLEQFKSIFKIIKVILDNGIYTDLRCYYGTSTYNKKDMNKLLSGIVEDARELGIETWDDFEIKRMIDSFGEK